MKEIFENGNNDEEGITDESNVALMTIQSNLVVKWRRTNSSAELCSMPLQSYGVPLLLFSVEERIKIEN